MERWAGAANLPMKTIRESIVLFSLLLLLGCKEKPPVPAPPKETQKPVVFVAPVPTKPYEEGYTAGFELGRERAAPQAPVPDETAIQELAREQAGGRPDRSERWERGFADGYLAGFRKVATGQN